MLLQLQQLPDSRTCRVQVTYIIQPLSLSQRSGSLQVESVCGFVGNDRKGLIELLTFKASEDSICFVTRFYRDEVVCGLTGQPFVCPTAAVLAGVQDPHSALQAAR
jgi:hypothetical protein